MGAVFLNYGIAVADKVIIQTEPVHIGADVGEATVAIGSNLWFNWAKIAIRQERRALAAREWGLNADKARAKAIGLETDEVIQTVAAVRHSFHNLWLAWHDRQLLPVDEESDLRPDLITTDLPADVDAWWQRIKNIVNWRNHVVHHIQQMAPTVAHPVYPTNVGALNATFTVEYAADSVDLLLDVFERVFERPSYQLQQWAEKRKHVPGQLELFRQTGEEF